ncbi:hypothetical protein VTG60DRAFT_4941 [Thermothelomyces hinnuleus]
MEGERASCVGLLVRLGRPGGLDGQELEAHLIPPVLLEYAGPLHGNLEVVPNLGLARKAGEAGGQRLGDVRVHQLLGPVHDPEADAEGASGADDAPDACHGLDISAGVIEGELELEGEAVLPRVEDVWRDGRARILVREDLADLVEDLMVLVQGVSAGRRPFPPANTYAWVLGRDAEGSPRLALELDDDGADVFMAAQVEKHAALDEVEIGVEFGRIVQDNAYRHDAGEGESPRGSLFA